MPMVVDTDVLSFLYKRDTRATLYEPHLNDPPFIVSFMSLAELRRWALERSWSESRRQELEEYLTRYLILHSDDQMCVGGPRQCTALASTGDQLRRQMHGSLRQHFFLMYR